MSSALPVQMVPHSRDDLRGEGAELDRATAAELLADTIDRLLDDASISCAVMDVDTFRAFHSLIHAIEALSDFIASSADPDVSPLIAGTSPADAASLTNPGGAAPIRSALTADDGSGSGDADHDPSRGRGPLNSGEGG